MDGCFDIIHSGHYNAIRKSKALGDVLVVGIHTNEEIRRNKRVPLLTDEERRGMVEACKWVDEIVWDVPYAPTLKLMEEQNIDFCAHGDDMPVDASSGAGAYDVVKHMLKIFKRTEGTSTTRLLQRIKQVYAEEIGLKSASTEEKRRRRKVDSDWLPCLANVNRLSRFANNSSPKEGARVIYVQGTFDLFHIGHLDFIKRAREMGDYLIVGVLSDRDSPETVVMPVYERCLCLLSCKYVDDVVIGCHPIIGRDLLTAMNASAVAVYGEVPKGPAYDYPRKAGMLVSLAPKPGLPTRESIFKRVHSALTASNVSG